MKHIYRMHYPFSYLISTKLIVIRTLQPYIPLDVVSMGLNIDSVSSQVFEKEIWTYVKGNKIPCARLISVNLANLYNK